MGVYIEIFTNAHIGVEEYAKPFFDLMQREGFSIKKVGLYEPVKAPFTLNDAIRLWIKEEPGLYDFDLNKMIGKAGSMLGKGNGFWFDIAWWLHPSELSLNYVTILLSKKLFNQKKSSVLTLFNELTSHFDAIYGYVSEELAQERQHTTGQLTERIPGIFWLNFFSLTFVNYLNSGNLLLDFPWETIKAFDDGSILTQLTNNPFDNEILEDLEIKAQDFLGKDKFNGSANDYPQILHPHF